VNASSSRCRACVATGLLPVLSLGSTPLANSLLTTGELNEPEDRYPLDLVFCPSCTLVQITKTIPPDVLFRDYLYLSSFSDSMLEHARALAERMTEEEALNGSSLVVEAASNDGYLLRFYKQLGVRVLGVEPALNVARVADERGIPTIPEFFDERLARRLADEGKRADVFHAHNVLAHVADLNGFVDGIAQILRDEGVALIEAPYVREMLERCEFDTIYHEHLCYFSLTALDRLFERHGLVVAHVEQVPVHGGSLRVFVKAADRARRGGSVESQLAAEQGWGVEDPGSYADFARRVEDLKAMLVELLGRLKSEGNSIAAYGAAAKGSTLLNYCGVGSETIDFVVDRSTVKQGHFMPGVRLPISAPERLLEAMPDYLLILAWNWADEIIAQQAEYRARGGRFIIPLPTPQVVS
jgi:SAM-dependent methyltransferase